MNDLKQYVRNMEAHAFDNFDPETYDPTLDSYDPSSATDSSYYDDEDGYDLPNGYSQRSPSRRKLVNSPLAQLDITIDNTTNTSLDVTIELFNYLRSNTMIANANYNTSIYQPQTYNKMNGLIPASALTGFSGTTPSILGPTASYKVASALDQMIYWDDTGSLIYAVNQGLTAYTKISCPQVPFRTLHEATRNNLLYIEKVRLAVKSDAQIDQAITIFKNTFLGGTKSNQIAPRSEFKPNQYQQKIVDVPFKTAIDAETGMYFKVKAQELMTMSLFFRFARGNEYAKGSISM